MLKADLHIHTKEDPEDKDVVKYSAKELINKAASLGFEVLSITCHDKVVYNEDLKKYAIKKGILLIPGVEKKIQGKHILIYNVKQEDIDKIKTLDDLNLLRRKNSLIIAPHPFYIKNSLGQKLIKYIDFFDAIEYSHFYLRWFNILNKKAAEIAKKYNKPLIGTSDAHKSYQFNKTYSLIDSKKDVNSIINAVKENKVKIVTKPLGVFLFLRILFGEIFRLVRRDQ